MVKSLTICICTYNRSNLLDNVLAFLTQMEVTYKIVLDVVIVDNASKDNTFEVSSKYVRSKPGLFRYVYEERPGLSNARNRGLQESTSEVIAFLDDDAVPRKGWLDALLEGYALGEDVGAVGGQILLTLPGNKVPWWFKKPLYSYYSEKEIDGESILECKEIGDYPFGANISFRRELIVNHGGFDSGLGRIGNQLLSGEETMLCRRIQTAGYRILLNPHSIVDHFIKGDRINLKCLFSQAWSDGKVYFVWHENQPRMLTLLLNIFKNIVTIVLNIFSSSSIIQAGYGIVANISILIHRSADRS